MGTGVCLVGGGGLLIRACYHCRGNVFVPASMMIERGECSCRHGPQMLKAF
jgi:hypothetical protein